MFPVTFSEELGLNVTFIDAFCPAANVIGVFIPLTVKSFALTLTCESVTLVFPVFEIVMPFELELPAFTFAKLKLLGDIESPACAPVPVIAIFRGEFAALLTTLTLPVTAPAVAGLNCTLKLLVCPDESVIGSVNVPRVKPLPVTPICVTVNVPVPLFCN